MRMELGGHIELRRSQVRIELMNRRNSTQRVWAVVTQFLIVMSSYL